MIRNEIAYTVIKLNTKVEVVAAEICIGETVIVIASIYIPPREKFSKEELENICKHFGKKYILFGDFNGHHEMWGSPENNER